MLTMSYSFKYLYCQKMRIKNKKSGKKYQYVTSSSDKKILHIIFLLFVLNM